MKKMSQALVIFTFENVDLTIQCSKNDKMRYICQKYATKINKNINSLIFLYGGSKLNLESTFDEQANSLDRNYKKMKVLVYINEDDGFTCPKCGGKIKLNTEELDKIILSLNEIKDTVDGIKIQIDNMIKNSSVNAVNIQLKNINKMINIINEDITKNIKKLKIIVNDHKFYNSTIEENKINNNIIKDDNIQDNNNKVVTKKKEEIKPVVKQIDKSQFKQAELSDPDDISSLNTLFVLKFKLNKYTQISENNTGRTPIEIIRKIARIRGKIYIIEESMGDKISPQDYLTLLIVTLKHDKILAEYFKQIGDESKFKLVEERIPIILEEIYELQKIIK